MRTAAVMAALTVVLLAVGISMAGLATAAEDPGFAYVDNNNDHQYEASDGDVDLSAVAIDDGFDTDVLETGYDPTTACGGGSCDGAGLVIPASVGGGTLTFDDLSPAVAFVADTDLVFGVNTVDDGVVGSSVVLRSDFGDVLLDDPIVRVGGSLVLQSPNGGVVARGDQLLACGTEMFISVTADGAIDLSYTNVRANGLIEITSTSGDIDIVGSVVGTSVVFGRVDVSADGDVGTIDATDAFIQSDAPLTPELNGDGSPPYTQGTVITAGATIAQGQLQCMEQVITEPPPTTTTATTTTTTGTTTTGTTTTGTTTTGTTTTGTTTTGTTTSGTTTSGTTTSGTTTTGTTTTGTTSTTTPSTTSPTGTTGTSTTSRTSPPTTGGGGVGGGQQSTTSGNVGGSTAFTGVQNVAVLAGLALLLFTTGSGLLWTGSRRGWRRRPGSDDAMWLRR